MANPEVYWTGKSGTKYGYWILDLNASFKSEPGNYIFAKKEASGNWAAVYIGETDDFKKRMSNHEKRPCAIRNGATHNHAHTSSAGEKVRRAEEKDLIDNYDPPCNKE